MVADIGFEPPNTPVLARVIRIIGVIRELILAVVTLLHLARFCQPGMPQLY